MFLLNVVFFGLNSALTILAAQYWGKGDTESIEKLFGYMFTLSLPVMAVFFCCAMFAPEATMSVFTNEPVLISGGVPYLRFASFSYIFMTLAMIYETLLKNVGFVKQCTERL